MSTTQVKLKRKQNPPAADDDLPGPSSTKKPRKDHKTKNGADAAAAATAAVAVTEVDMVESLKKRRDKKGKARAGEGDESEFTTVRASVVVSIPPIFASNARAGVEEMLDSMLMRYIPALQGVVLAHSDLTFPQSKAAILRDCPYAVTRVEFNATTWSPRVGMKLKGKVTLSSPDHVALLVHRTFNVSIPRHHLPSDEWAFEHGPAENDPEFGAGADAEDGAEADGRADGAGENGETEDEGGVDTGGRWVSNSSGERLGDKGLVEFTVVGLTIANQMLSLVGSIQPDPFSPKHVPSNVEVSPAKSPVAKASGKPTAHEVDEDGEGIAEDDDQDEIDADPEAAEEEERRAEEQRQEEEKRRKEEEKREKKERKERKRKAKEEAAATISSTNTEGASEEERKKKKKKMS